MRVLFASLASAGHTYPMVPLAVAAREAGHDVHFAVGTEMHEPLRSLGLRPFRPADVFYEIYAEDLAPELTRLRPDLVVLGWGLSEAGTAVDRAAIPGLWHGFGRLFPDGIGLRRPSLTRPHLDVCPPSLQDKDFHSTAQRIELRPVPFSPPAPLDSHGSRPLIYLTLGTAFGTAETLRVTIAALARLDAQIVVAAGRVPVAELGAVPRNVSVRPWVAQAQLLPHVDLVVHHGGSGTTLGALSVGAPQLVLPQGADQFANADVVCAAGAALRVLPEELSEDVVEERARLLLHSNGGHREAARAIAEEIAMMPSPDEVARRLPEYAR